MGNFLSRLADYACGGGSNYNTNNQTNTNKQFNNAKEFNRSNSFFRKVSIIKPDVMSKSIIYDDTPPYFINTVPCPLMNELTNGNRI